MLSRLLPLMAGLGAAVCLAVPPPAAAANVLAPEVVQALQRERVPLEAVSVLVQEAGSGTTRLTLNAQQAGQPGLAGQAADDLCRARPARPGLQLEDTGLAGRRWGSGAQAGVLEGNVHIQGRGDPKLTLERLWLLVQRLRQMGVSEIRGDIVLDQSAFVVPETSLAEFDNEPLRPYNVRAQALLLNLHAVLYTFTPDAASGVARVSAEPALAGRAGRCQRAARQRPLQRLARCA